MIIRTGRRLLGGYVSTVRTPLFTCVIDTRKEWMFGPLSTMIMVGDESGAPQQSRLCGKITFSSGMGRQDIPDLHGAIVSSVDREGEKGSPLGAALQGVIEAMKREGYVSEAINAAPWGLGSTALPDKEA